MRILVTGSSGLLGAQLVRFASLSGREVFSAYNLRPPAFGSPVHLDLERLDTIEPTIQKIRPDIIIHAAAVTDVDLCEEKPDLARLVNGEATGKLAEAAKAVGGYMMYVSTDYVFDGGAGEYNENDIPNPVNHYGESKLLGEQLVGESGAKFCIARTSVLYGWGREHRPNLATRVINKLQARERVRVVDDQFASPTFNINLAEMILEVSERRTEGIFHLAGATRVDRYAFALQIAGLFHLDPSLIERVSSKTLNWKAKRPVDSSLNVERAARLLDRKPLKLSEGLERFRGAQSR